jgi:hypothetical protein
MVWRAGRAAAARPLHTLERESHSSRSHPRHPRTQMSNRFRRAYRRKRNHTPRPASLHFSCLLLASGHQRTVAACLAPVGALPKLRVARLWSKPAEAPPAALPAWALPAWALPPWKATPPVGTFAMLRSLSPPLAISLAPSSMKGTAVSSSCASRADGGGGGGSRGLLGSPNSMAKAPLLL